MSSSQSGLYQSKVVSFVTRQTRQWLDRGGIAWRRLKMTANWTAQLLLYPVYVVFQTVRLTGAQVRQAVELGVAASDGAGGTAETQPRLTPDTPIQTALLLVDQFSLPTDLPVRLEQPALAVATSQDGLVAAPSSTTSVVVRAIGRVVTTVYDWLGRASEKLVASRPANQFQLQATAVSPTFVQGIVSVLETRAIALVTNQNEILDVLTVGQQHHLRQRIEAEITRYGRSYQLQQASRKIAASLAPIVQTSQQILPQALLQQLVTTLQASPAYLAGAHLRQWVESHFPGLLPPGFNARTLAVSLGDRLLAGTTALLPVSDTPLYQALYTAQQFSPAELLPAHRLTASPLPPQFIRGIATLLETRAIVLVTNGNESLDILTTDQQRELQTALVWEVASYGRYLHLRQQTARVLTNLRATAENRYLLPPVRLFRQLMAWMQTSPLAIATNLFEEAALVRAAVLPAHGPTPLAEVAFPELPFPELPRQVSLPPLPLPKLLAPASNRPSLLHGWFPNKAIGKREQNEVKDPAIALPLPAVTAIAINSPSPEVGSLAASVAINNVAVNAVNSPAIATACPQSSTWDYIDTEATSVGYVPSLLERVLKGLDVCFLWLEGQFAKVWHGLKQQTWLVNSLRLVHDDEWRINLWQRIRELIARLF